MLRPYRYGLKGQTPQVNDIVVIAMAGMSIDVEPPYLYLVLAYRAIIATAIQI